MSRSFEDRHIGPTSVDEAAMLKRLGYKDLASFIADVVPANIAINGVIESALDSGKSEVEVIAELRQIAEDFAVDLCYNPINLTEILHDKIIDISIGESDSNPKDTN